MVRALLEADKRSIADVAKKQAVSVQTLYAWKKQFGAMGIDDTKRLKSLEAEDGKPRKVLADRMLDIEVLKDINSKKW